MVYEESDLSTPVTSELREIPGKAFPRLSSEMVSRVERYGHLDQLESGYVLYQVGDREVDFFVVLNGAVDVFEADGRGGNALIASHRENQFTGELNHLSGRGVLVRAIAIAPTKVIRVDRTSFRKLLSAEPDISEIILRAFILRRARLLDYAEGGTMVVGSCRSGDTLRIQTFLERNGYPYRCLDTDEDTDALAALEAFHANVDSLPIVVLDGTKVLTQPSNRELAANLEISERLVEGCVYDVIVVGAGPAGLAAAVYASSEGLNTLIIEALGPGGQASTSSRIENYLGFPMGISGQNLARRAQIQAQKFGARFAVADAASKLDCSCYPFRVHLDDGTSVLGRSIVVATGARYRRLSIPDADRFEGSGIHYAATSIEAELCVDSEVAVVGGGNSAGQAAVFLSERAKHVHLLVRGNGLSDTMSDYLIERITNSSRITLHTRSHVTALSGDRYLSSVEWEMEGLHTKRSIPNLFLMIGAVPNTDWLNGCVDLDEKGFVKTGYIHEEIDLGTSYSTSAAGIFAVGDVRSNSVKRVASSVGEGSVVVHAIHSWLAHKRASELKHDNPALEFSLGMQ